MEYKGLEHYLMSHFSDEDICEDPGLEYLDFWNAQIAKLPYFSAAQLLSDQVFKSKGLEFQEPAFVSLELYHFMNRVVPIIVIGNDLDFEMFLTKVLYKGQRNEGIPKMGASFIYGKTTRFIVLSCKPYSNIPADWFGLEKEQWREMSMILRREHECVHFYTKLKYGISLNHFQDELMADFFGIYAAFGKYEAKTFCHLMGLDAGTKGRWTLYVEGLDPSEQEQAKEYAKMCSEYLEQWSKSEGFRSSSPEDRIKHLCRIGMEGMLQERQGGVE